MRLTFRNRGTEPVVVEAPAPTRRLVVPTDPMNEVAVELDRSRWEQFALRGAGPVELELRRVAATPREHGAVAALLDGEAIGHLGRSDSERYWGALATVDRLGTPVFTGQLVMSPAGWWAWLDPLEPDALRAWAATC